MNTIKAIVVYACAIATLLHLAAPSGSAEEAKTAGSSPKVSGSVDVTASIYKSEKPSIYQTAMFWKAFGSLNLDVDFNDSVSLHTNGRISYISNKAESPRQWHYDLYFLYVDAQLPQGFAIQAGRILDIKNLVYTYYDGLNLQYSNKVSDKFTVTVDAYGGIVVKDDYLEKENKNLDFINPTWGYYLTKRKYINSHDVQNLASQQRSGDYLGGAKASFLANDIGIFNVDYQAIFNKSKLAEHYVSLDFDTFFSKIVQIYGYGTFDLIGKLPSKTLLAVKITPVQLVSIVVEHEYYRPVFMKDSFWDTHFEKYANHEAVARLIFAISDKMTADLKYGRIFYAGAHKQGNEVAVNFEHRDLAKMALRVGADYINGPDGDRLTARAMLSRRVHMFDFLVGGGISLVGEDQLFFNGFRPAPFATAGVDITPCKGLIMTANGEYSMDNKFKYNIKGLFSVKYLFSTEK